MPTDVFSLGRRLERLYYWGVLILLVCFLGALLATAANDELRLSNLQEVTYQIELIEQNYARLVELYTTSRSTKEKHQHSKVRWADSRWYSEQVPKLLAELTDYDDAITLIAIRSSPKFTGQLFHLFFLDSSGGWAGIGLAAGLLGPGNEKGPSELLPQLFEKRKKLTEDWESTAGGIEMPHVLQLQIEGLPLKISLNFFTIVTALVITPAVIIWLMSVYVTRKRELFFIGDRHSLDYFPHMFNPVPVISSSQDRKWKLFMRSLERYVVAGTRVIFIFLFLVTMLIFTEYTNYTIWFKLTDSQWVHYVAGFLMLLLLILSILVGTMEISATLGRGSFITGKKQ